MPTTLIAYNDQQRALAKTRNTYTGLKDIFQSDVDKSGISVTLNKGVMNLGEKKTVMSFKQHRNTEKQKQSMSSRWI